MPTRLKSKSTSKSLSLDTLYVCDMATRITKFNDIGPISSELLYVSSKHVIHMMVMFRMSRRSPTVNRAPAHKSVQRGLCFLLLLTSKNRWDSFRPRGRVQIGCRVDQGTFQKKALPDRTEHDIVARVVALMVTKFVLTPI
jgi:hypothetical protein